MKVILIILLLVLPLSAITAQDEEAEGDEKIEDTIRKIQEEAEAAEEGEEYSGDEEEGDSCVGCEIFGDIFFEILGELFFQYMALLRFAPYPYADQSLYRYSTLVSEPGEDGKIASLQTSVDLSIHFDGTYGNTNRLSAQLSALHFNLFNQTFFSRSESLTNLSLNGGLSLVIGGFHLDAFAGAYTITGIDSFVFSMGLGSRLFLPGGLYLDLYNLYAFLGDRIRFIHLVTSLNYTVWRFSFGAGYNYSSIVGDIYAGPCLKISFWL
jgi:hypothetical protein